MDKKAPGVSGRRRGFSKLRDDVLYGLVRAAIVEYAGKSRNADLPVRAEWYANEFRVPVHRITQVFMRLNHEGLMSQKVSEKNDLAWNASGYYVRCVKEVGDFCR